jgi:large subunit ribosomal protein L32e
MSTAAKPAKATKVGKSGSISNAMRTKRILRAARPTFRRHGSQRKGEVKAAWRKPRGLHNKQKDNKKNRLARPDNGWRTPIEVRGLHSSGLSIVRVAHLAQLTGLDPAVHGVVIASVGARAQIALIDAAAKSGLRVLNYDAHERKQMITKRYDARREERKVARVAKAETEKSKEKAAKDKKATDAASDDEKKAEQEKIKEEVLTDKHN